MKPFVASVLTLALSGCAALPALGGVDRAAAIRQCMTDVGPRWIAPAPRLDSLLLLGTVEDPSTVGGRLVTSNGLRTFGGSVELWMTKTGLKRVDLYIQPGLDPDDTYLLGPRRGEPTGIYAFERLPGHDARCAAYDRTTAARAAAHPAAPPIIEGPDCVAFRYVGPLTLEGYGYIVFNYADVGALRAGYMRFVEELRWGVSTPVARAVAYRLPGYPATCAPTTEYLTTLLK